MMKLLKLDNKFGSLEGTNNWYKHIPTRASDCLKNQRVRATMTKSSN